MRTILRKNKERAFSLGAQDIYLRPLTLNDVGPAYLRWMNDRRVNRFLESRFSRHSLASLRSFVRKAAADPDIYFFAIVQRASGRHIGNIKLGPVDRRHRCADIGILIGEKDCWGKGYATQAIRALSSYAFGRLRLHKITAGCYAPNKGSLSAFRKNGFRVEGVRRKHCCCGGRYVDDILLGRVRPGA